MLTTCDTRRKKFHGRYVEVYGPYQVEPVLDVDGISIYIKTYVIPVLNVEGISIYIKTYFITDIDQIGQIYLGQEEIKVRRIGHDVMMEQDAVHI